MPRRKTETDIYRQQLEKEAGYIEVFNRLSQSGDFKVWIEEFIEKPITALRTELDEIDFEKDFKRGLVIQAQIKLLKQQRDVFQRRRERARQIGEKLQVLSK